MYLIKNIYKVRSEWNDKLRINHENSYAFLGGSKFEKNCIFKGINKILHLCTAGNFLDPD